VEVQVGRICLALAAFVLLSISAASGQYIKAKQTCSRDVTAFCNAAKSEPNGFVECIKAHFQEFSEPCKSALVTVNSVRKACQVDFREQCPANKPGSGRSLLCLREHFSALSNPCKGAIAQAAATRLRQ
jgi:hypothetical protein